jgi:phosphoglycolate phosphatase
MVMLMFVDRKFLAVGFDMDSTLLDTDMDYMRLRRVVFNEMTAAGVPEHLLSIHELSKFNLDRGIDFLKKNGRSGEIDGILERVETEIREIEMENSDLAKPYTGAETMLMHLKKKGYKIGVLTRANRRYAEKALTISGVIGMLDALVCKDDFHESESKPSPVAMRNFADALGVGCSDILYLGDSKIDHHCARDSGAGFIGVLTRYTEEDWTVIDKNVRMIDTVTDLIKIL